MNLLITLRGQSLALAALLLVRPPLALATTHTWTGNSPNTNNWSDSLNWTNGSPPPSDPTTDVIFSSAGLNGPSSPNSFQDFTTTSSFLLRTMTFALPGTSPFTLAGGRIGFVGTELLTQSSAAPVTISNSLAAETHPSGGASDLTITGDGVGLLTLSGPVNQPSSSLGLRKQGSSTVLLTGTSQSYNLSVEGGTMRNTGTQSVSRFATIASTTVAAAVYQLEAGSFSANNGLTVGGTGPGTFAHSGGSNSSIGTTIGAGGTYNLSAGTMAGSLSVNSGGAFVQTAGSGGGSTLTVQSGGSIDVSGGTFGGGNTYVGAASGSPALFKVTQSGTANLSALGLLATGTLEIRSGGTAVLGSGSTDAGSTVLLSNPASGGNALTVGNTFGPHNFTFSGVIADGLSGPGGITCLGQGQTIFHGMNTYTGPTQVSTGLLAGNGRIAGPVSLTSGAVISPGNFVLAPPPSSPSHAGTFRVGSLTMAQGTTYLAQLYGAETSRYDVLEVSGTVNLSNPTLSLELTYNALPGQIFTILNVAGGGANPIIGQFANAPDNSVVLLGGGFPNYEIHYYYVDYQGGDGNDLTLTFLNPLVVSRKSHGDLGTFDTPLTVVGPAASECRTGGPDRNFTLVFTFADQLVSVGNAQVTGGVGSISSHGLGADPRQYVVNLTGVNNLQRLTVALSNVNDSAGHSFSSISSTMRVLLGDTSGEGTVNSGDATQTRARSGEALDGANFRSDVNCDGSINSGDAVVVKARSGNSVP